VLPVPTAPSGAVIPYNGGPLVIDAAINGVPVRLMLDTGAERTLITHAALARAGIDLSTGTPVQIRGVTGDAAATLVSIPRLDIAGTRIGPLPVIAHTLTSPNIDGLLGRDVLDGFTVTVDAAASRATLIPR
jgi:predicted aspartyl protease